MAALLLRHGAARRLGGNDMVQRAEAAVAEGRRQLGPRTMHTEKQAHGEIRREIDQKKEELYDVMCKAQQISWISSLLDKRLLQHLALHVNPKPEDSQWRRLCFARRAKVALDTAGFVTSAGVAAYFVVQLVRS